MLNISSLRTPGVYIDEVPKFPPSIAAVETAIPAFIGFTAKTSFNGVEFLNKVTEVESMVDFEEKFGGAPPVNITSVKLGLNNAVIEANSSSNFYLYDSMRMYFSNGGGRCYVVTIGDYNAYSGTADLQSKIQSAINEIELEDEVTLFVFPDGIKLTPTQLGSLHAQALAQCEKYKDRFLIADVIINDPSNERYVSADIDNFKTAIGMGDLQFGGAYYPYLKVNLPREIKYRDIRDKVFKLGAKVNWVTDFIEPADADTISLFTALDQLVVDSGVINALKTNNPPGAYAYNELEGRYQELKALFQTELATYRAIDTPAPGDIADLKTATGNLFDFIYEVVYTFMDQIAKHTASPIGDPLLKALRTRLDNEVLGKEIADLVKVDSLLESGPLVQGSKIGFAYSRHGRTWAYNDITDTDAPADWKSTIASAASLSGAQITATYGGTYGIPSGGTAGATTANNLETLVNSEADKIFYGIYIAVSKMYDDAVALEAANEQSVLRRIPVMAGVINYLRAQNFLLPPSGAIAGVYARVDGSRGVWKAPANESLRNVIAPSVKLSHDQHGLLNVDPSFGKSINAVRHFTGKGNLVFGARTLAGNDNEWRYVSVRRFFNMVEESSKKATEQFVFEPNDENTWVRVQAMIENFLTTLWRQGALQGSTTEQAFYVQVGLGKTMTALDILEGRMIVEIGMAVVRPAEFIILRFSHKLPEA